jgi:hypothetical protein
MLKGNRAQARLQVVAGNAAHRHIADALAARLDATDETDGRDMAAADTRDVAVDVCEVGNGLLAEDNPKSLSGDFRPDCRVF